MEFRRIVPVAAAALVLAVALILGLKAYGSFKGAGAESYVHQGTQDELPVLWQAPDFRYVDQRGETVTRDTLKGKVWVANFIFTQCKTVCPLLTAKMVQLQRVLKGAPVEYVSFSVDPEHDTPEVLAAYAKKWDADTAHWRLLSTDAQTLPTVTAGFKVTAMKSKGGPDPIIHSAIFLLVDGQGMVRGAYSSEDRQDWAALEAAAQQLAGSQAKPATLPEDGKALYMQLSCAGCHERPELAPSLAGKAGAKVELANGLLTTFDETYVKESIRTPQAKMVRGYTLQMPSYDTLLDEARLDTLTKWVMARPKDPDAKTDAARVEVDPVCHMKVRVQADTPQASHGGHTYYFCSDMCRERFAAAPQSFTGDAGTP